MEIIVDIRRSRNLSAKEPLIGAQDKPRRKCALPHSASRLGTADDLGAHPVGLQLKRGVSDTVGYRATNLVITKHG